MFLLSLSCHNDNEGFVVKNRKEEAVVDIPTLNFDDFEIVSDNYYDGSYIFKSLHDSITVQISLGKDSNILENYFKEESHKRKRDTNYSYEYGYLIETNIFISPEMIVKQNMVINRIDNNGHVNCKYLVRYVHLIILKGKYLGIDVIKEFNEFDVVQFYNWSQQFSKIKIVNIKNREISE